MYCLDTYALVEISEENGLYDKILEADFVVTSPTMAEFYLIMYTKFNEKTANYWFKRLKPSCVNPDEDIWIKAVKFRYEHKSENLSIFDCIGYIYSVENGCLFVTGDKEFKNKKGVEFIK